MLSAGGRASFQIGFQRVLGGLQNITLPVLRGIKASAAIAAKLSQSCPGRRQLPAMTQAITTRKEWSTMYHKTGVHIGRKVRERRVALGWSQSDLADRLGISFQQVQKYESGANLISGSRIWDIANVL